MAATSTVKWLDAPAEHDYPSAASYLRLIAVPAVIEAVTTQPAKGPTVQQHDKDVLDANIEIPRRIADLPALGAV